MNADVLIDAGIDYEKGVNRVLGDIDLYERILNAFLSENTVAQAQLAFDKRDYKKLFSCAHSIKGMSGNIEITDLYRDSCLLTEYLRNNDQPDYRKTGEMFENMRKSYRDAESAIKKALGGN